MADAIQNVALDRIPEIKDAITELKRQRDVLIQRLINGVSDWDEYNRTSGKVQGLSLAIAAPFVPRELS